MVNELVLQVITRVASSIIIWFLYMKDLLPDKDKLSVLNFIKTPT